MAGSDETNELQQRAGEAAELLAGAAALRGTEPPTPAQLQPVVKRLDRNVLCVGDHTGVAGSALFRCTSMFNHACRPNAFAWFVWGQGGGGGGLSTAVAAATDTDQQTTSAGTVCVELRAAQDINQGSEVCIGYTDAHGKPRSERREEIAAFFGFDCACSRCCTADNEGTAHVAGATVAAADEREQQEEAFEPLGSVLSDGSVVSLAVLRRRQAQAKELWFSAGNGSSPNLSRATKILEDALSCWECVSEFSAEASSGCSALASVMAQMGDTLASVLIAQGKHRDAYECLQKWANGRRRALSTAYPALSPDLIADFTLAMRQLDLCRLAIHIATEEKGIDNTIAIHTWVSLADSHARAAQRQLVVLIGQRNAQNVCAHHEVAWEQICHS